MMSFKRHLIFRITQKNQNHVFNHHRVVVWSVSGCVVYNIIVLSQMKNIILCYIDMSTLFFIIFFVFIKIYYALLNKNVEKEKNVIIF